MKNIKLRELMHTKARNNRDKMRSFTDSNEEVSTKITTKQTLTNVGTKINESMVCYLYFLKQLYIFESIFNLF